ncbi:hypothetical protein ACOSQ3_013350 [Xanthoceras sorbifolium]
MLGDAQHVEEAEKIGLDYMDVETLKDDQVWLAGGSLPPRAAKVSTRAARFIDSEVVVPSWSSLGPPHWPCTYWSSSTWCQRAAPCICELALGDNKSNHVNLPQVHS